MELRSDFGPPSRRDAVCYASGTATEATALRVEQYAQEDPEYAAMISVLRDVFGTSSSSDRVSECDFEAEELSITASSSVSSWGDGSTKSPIFHYPRREHSVFDLPLPIADVAGRDDRTTRGDKTAEKVGPDGLPVLGNHTAPIDPVSLPEVGEEFCGFQLVEELGRGMFSRVYLAKQASLAGRQVAVKVTLKATKEPERLARLQHLNVVPVYSVHDAAPAQIICMPYLGRRTLADALSGFRKSHAAVAGLSTRIAGSRAGSTAANHEPKSGTRPTDTAIANAVCSASGSFPL